MESDTNEPLGLSRCVQMYHLNLHEPDLNHVKKRGHHSCWKYPSWSPFSLSLYLSVSQIQPQHTLTQAHSEPGVSSNPTAPISTFKRSGLHMPLISTYRCLIYLSDGLTLHLLSQTNALFNRQMDHGPSTFLLQSLQMTASSPLRKQSDNATGHVSSPSVTKHLPQQPRGRWVWVVYNQVRG